MELAVLFICGGIYISCGMISTRKYLEWASANKLKARLPDLMLDFIQDHNTISPLAIERLTLASDILPFFLLITGIVLYLVWQYIDILNFAAMTTSFLIINNSIVENVTILPFSSGRERCLELIDLDHLDKDGILKEIKTINPLKYTTGTCATMMWSGHTVHTMIASYVICSAKEYFL